MNNNANLEDTQYDAIVVGTGISGGWPRNFVKED